MELTIEQATAEEIDEIALLYEEVVGHLVAGTNYPGWIKGVYPTRGTAEDAVAGGTLYVARQASKLVGAAVLNQKQEPAYHTVQWAMDAQDADILVVHTLVVHPSCPRRGIAEGLIQFAAGLALARGMKAIRLDVHEKNTPAIRLYQKCGFQFVGTVSLGFERYGLKWYKLFEKVLERSPGAV